MKTTLPAAATGKQGSNTVSKRIAMLRIGFGLIWAIDAGLKFEPTFYRTILVMVKGMDAGEPSWLNWWFHTWYHIIGSSPHAFAIITIVIETLIALSLLLGVARRLNYALGAVFSFLIWGVAEGFGGPYVAGSTDLNAGIIYVFVFLLLYVCDNTSHPSWSLDPIIENHVSWWHHITHPRIALNGKLDRLSKAAANNAARKKARP